VPTPEREAVEAAATVSFVCQDCGRVHSKNTPPCNDCGSMRLEAEERAVDESLRIDEDESWALVRDANAGVTGVGILVTLVGVVTLLLGVANFGLGLYFVAPNGIAYGTLLLAAGTLATPRTRRRVEPLLPIHLSPVGVLVAYLALVGVGLVLDRVLPGVGF